MNHDLLRSIPSVETLLNDKRIVLFTQQFQRHYLKLLVQNFLEYIRSLLMDEAQVKTMKEEILENIIPSLEEYLRLFADDNYKRVINATGIILHTNLGRAPLCSSAVNKILTVIGGFINVEYDLEEGTRGERDEPIQELFQLLLEAPATAVVNNNAAATFIVLNTFAEGREVIISRGELIEIGASFRLPEIMLKSGAIMKEVGATNKTRISDYEHAFSEKTEVILRVHPSNYKITGFVERPALEDLISLAKKNGYYIFKDLGSGNILDLTDFGFGFEPNAKAALQSGVDLVLFSGDKILGGPQCGIICGKDNLVSKIKSNPLYRAMRVDKLTLVALEATLRCYLKGTHLNEIVPLRMLTSWVAELQLRARKFLRNYRKQLKSLGMEAALTVEPIATISYLGGGFAPAEEIQSYGLSLSSSKLKPAELHTILRLYKIPIIARIEKESLILDFRTIQEHEEEILIEALIEIQKALGLSAVKQNGLVETPHIDESELPVQEEQKSEDSEQGTVDSGQ
ncbi:MAG: L-seryl-tRNA(Sec) selenium transferase [Candidatus Fischerbacteria bacterium RBG_13_37_8]|uniref:L-seryl-tRNA(Sec) selenium transferase n=1 Tax=Candidatus Fischerbacteria bacterium RBG_13_37_8 TaxID=1817863 RepID=A0A1F5VP52_9BACT|nr:MAG: L-seryl-tRNA(Sec) selenium transferase [Candidatus Fischerbacteria bacterium RBG_13_37_8]